MSLLAAEPALLCGAGVSVGSGLPDGQEMARLAFDLVVDGSGVYSHTAVAAVHEALSWPSNGEPALRLELVLDLMARHVQADVLAGVYSSVLGAAPCLAHYAVAAAGMPVLTTNQDELIERAAVMLGVSVNVLHLHGRTSQPGSIVTMLSQYVNGMPAGLARETKHHVTGKNLLVVGYSGRDLDVMPYLYGAASVTWIHYQPGNGPPPAAEVCALQTALGSRMSVIASAHPVQWILDRLPSATQHMAAVAARGLLAAAGQGGVTSSALAEFREIGLIERRLAVARILLHIGQAKTAHEGLLRAARSHRDNPQIQLMIADSLVSLQQRSASLRRYSKAAAMSTDPRIRASAMLGSAHTHANSGKYPKALQYLRQARAFADQISDERTRVQQEAWISALQARICAVTDDEDSAIRLYRQVAVLAGKIGNLDLRVTALVFGSDLLRSRGLYARALTQLAHVFEDNELYGRPYIRVWGRFYRGEIRCAAGQLADGIADLQSCRDHAQRSANYQAVAWASLALASYYRPGDLRAAQQAVSDCETAMSAYGRQMLLCDIRLAWERAELARACGRSDDALRQIGELRQRLSSPGFPAVVPYMTPHMLALEGEIARQRCQETAHSILRKARELYAASHWRHYVARMDVSLWIITGRAEPPKALLDRCRRYSYAEEIEYLTHPRPGYIPLHGL